MPRLPIHSAKNPPSRTPTARDGERPPSSFRTQLSRILTTGILALAISASVTTAWFTTANIRTQLVRDGLQVTESLAKQSVLALLYDSPENAEDAVRAAMGFPAVTGVTIMTSKNQPLLKKGHMPPISNKIDLSTRQAYLIENEFSHWIFVAPVYSQPSLASEENSLLPPTQHAAELLGYVMVSKSKSNLSQVLLATVVNNLIIALVIAIALLLLIRRAFTRMMRPLDNLTAVMSMAESGMTNVYASAEGPKEVVDIARAFNKMMEALAERDLQLRRHNELLEYEVAQRTQDLVYARDMAIQANRNKSNFLSSISHELRTPLQAIIGYSDLLLGTLPESMVDERQDIGAILKNGQNLLVMINSILDLAKIESGRMSLTPSLTNLPRLIDDVTDTIKPLLAANNNQLHVDMRLESPWLLIDNSKLRQILLNLLGNACKFTHSGSVRLKAWRHNDVIEIEVADSGIGIKPADLPHIFQPFYQAEGGETRNYQGTGLGLAITREFCHLMGGDISVSSTPGAGSTFTVVLPVTGKDSEISADQ